MWSFGHAADRAMPRWSDTAASSIEAASWDRPRRVITKVEQRARSQVRSTYVFPSRTGGSLNITNVRERVWKPGLRRAGLRYRTMYQTRHTFATLALQSGEQIGWVSKQLGHTSDEMVIRHYAKFIPNLTRRDGPALAKVMQEQSLA
jgi:integrase